MQRVNAHRWAFPEGLDGIDYSDRRSQSTLVVGCGDTAFLAVTKVAVLFMERSVPSAVESRRVRANYSRI